MTGHPYPRNRRLVLALLAAAVLGGPLAATPQPPASAGRTVSPASAAPASPRQLGAPHLALGNSYYFNWYDNASPGMTNDNIHIVATGPGTTTGTIALGSQTLPFSLAQGATNNYKFAPGTIGGPVVVTSSGPIVAVQRVSYFRSFSETPARNSADSVSWFNWYDNASPGVGNDNFHLLNPGGTVANVDINVAGTDLQFQVGPGAEVYRGLPRGSIGGPVKVTSDQPLITTQRVQFQQSFSEVAAVADTSARTSLYFNWYDHASPGMDSDNLHMLNPGYAPANVNLNVAGTSLSFQVAPGAEVYRSLPPGSIGGPVVVTSDQPLVASQRVVYYGAFSETNAASQDDSATDAWLPWYDNASPCMLADNIHLTTAGPGMATGQILLGGQSPIHYSVSPWQEAHYEFPKGTIGGPVHVLADAGTPGVIVEQRVVVCPPPPPPPPAHVRKIVVSLSQQHLWAYDNGSLFLQTDVTTGRPALPTPPGDYHIFYKQSPYEMISPWPYGSPFWYPNAWVNWVEEFREGGYFLHDAPWRSWFGPGSNIGDGTHGCINVPDGPMYQLWGWAQNGDEVLVQN